MRLTLSVSVLLLLGCAGLFATEGATPAECSDLQDNDGNGLIDCLDAGCAETDACAAEADVDTDTDSDTDTDTDADLVFDVDWDSDGATLLIEGGSGRYSLGFAEEIDGGWYGEDCVDGPGPNSGDFDFCHDSMQDGGQLATVTSLDDITENETTLFSDQTSRNLAYILIKDDENCWVLDDADGYYADEGFDCTEL